MKVAEPMPGRERGEHAFEVEWLPQRGPPEQPAEPGRIVFCKDGAAARDAMLRHACEARCGEFRLWVRGAGAVHGAHVFLDAEAARCWNGQGTPKPLGPTAWQTGLRTRRRAAGAMDAVRGAVVRALRLGAIDRVGAENVLHELQLALDRRADAPAGDSQEERRHS